MLDLHAKKVFTIRDVDGTVDAWDGINSEYAMFFEGPWFFGSYEEKLSQGIIAATIPPTTDAALPWSAAKTSRCLQPASMPTRRMSFAKFMTSEAVQLAMLEKGQLPVLKSLVNNETVLNKPVWSVYMKQLESASARIPSPNNEQIKQVWSDAMTEIFVNGGTCRRR